MKHFYFYTALLVVSLVHNPGTVVAHQFLRNAADQAWLRFQSLRDGRLKVLELTTADFDAAPRLCLGEAPALRAGDALHIAFCQRQICQLVGFDQAMCAAAVHHRVACQLLRISSG